MHRPAPNIQASLPDGPSPTARSKTPRSHVGSQPPPAAADRNPPMTRPASNGRRHDRPDTTAPRWKYGTRVTRLHTSSRPVDTPKRRLPTKSRASVTPAMPIPASAQCSGGRPLRISGMAGLFEHFALAVVLRHRRLGHEAADGHLQVAVAGVDRLEPLGSGLLGEDGGDVELPDGVLDEIQAPPREDGGHVGPPGRADILGGP